MTVQISNTNLNDSFNTWRLNTNFAATVISNNVVTVNPGGDSDRGGYAEGNGHVNGVFSASQLSTTLIKGGNTSVESSIVIGSNTTIGGAGLHTLTVSANTTISGNVIINTTGNEVFNLGNISRMRMTGGSAGQYLRKIGADNLDFNSLTLRQLTDLSSNSAHIILSGANSSFSDNGDSTHLIFGSGSDRAHIYLAKDVTVGDSDLYVNLVDADGDSAFVIADSANSTVFSIDSNGEVDLIGRMINGGATVIGSNGKLHANNTITNATILNAMLDTTGVSADTYGAAGTVPIITVNAQGRVTGVTTAAIPTTTNVDYTQSNNVISVVAGGSTFKAPIDAATANTDGSNGGLTNRGVASFDSTDFTVTSGFVSLKDASTGAVLAINGTSNEVEVSRTNGTVTIGLPDSLTVGTIAAEHSIYGDLTANGAVINLGDDRTGVVEATRNTMFINGGLSTLNVYANTIFHDRVTLSTPIESTGPGTFASLTVNGTSNLKGSTTIGDETTDTLDINGTITHDSGTIFGKNGKLHANNTITNGTIVNAMLDTTGVSAASYGGATAIPVITVNAQGRVTGVTTSSVSGVTNVLYTQSNNVIGIVTATETFETPIDVATTTSGTGRGVASFDSDDFSLSSGHVSLKDASTGAVLAINGTTNEVEVSRTNGTVTVGLPNNVTLAGDLTVNGGDIILGGTGRIQGIDTVSSGTDAANKTYVDTAISNLIDTAPAALDTLNELAAALGDDPNFATTLTTNLGQKLGATASVTLTGAVTGSASFSANAVTIATTATSDPTLTINGDASGSATFTNLGNATLTLTIADDSHNHIIGNIDGLQTALDAKQPIDADLTTIAGLSSADGNFIVGSASGWVVESGATVRTSLGLGSLATLSEVGAAQITDNSVGAAELNVSGNGTAGQALLSDGDGSMSWGSAIGPQGAKGDKGDKGDVGPQGATGPTGPQGPQGQKGQKGQTGSTGPTGPQGPIGLKGPTGAQGPTGSTGPQGPTGAKGDKGQKGETPSAIDIGLGITNDVRFDSLGIGTSASGTTGEIRATNNITAYYSDARLKTFLGKIDNALEKVCSLNGYYFEENDTAKSLGYSNSRVQIGVSAQEVQSVLPEIVTEAPIDGNYLTVWYDKLVPVLIEAIKELSAEIDELKKNK